MDNNAKKSFTGNSRHINIQHFSVKDRVDSGNMLVAYRCKEHMLVYLFKIYLQGALFVKFQ